MGSWFGGGKSPSVPAPIAPVEAQAAKLTKEPIKRTETVFGGKGKGMLADKDYLLGNKSSIARKLLLGE